MLTTFSRLARVAAIVASLALGGLLLGAWPAAAAPARAASNVPALPPPTAATQAKLRAYGKSCAKLGRRADAHVKRSAFAACLDAMARLGSERTKSPSKACRALSRKRVKGKSGTPYSRCVVAGTKLLRDKRRAAAAPAAGDAGGPAGEDDAGAGEPPEDPAPEGSDGEPEDPGGDGSPDDGPGDVDPDSLPGPVIE